MPPRRRPPAPTAAPKPKTPRQSALAKENNISAATESEIKEAYTLFSPAKSKDSLPSTSFRRALAALNIPPASRAEYDDLLAAADPEDEGVIPFANFVAVASLKINARGEDEQSREVRDGFELFMRMGGGDNAGGKGAAGEERITMAMLRRVAALLKEDVDDDMLKNMLLEANGGVGVREGVSVEDFEGVMRRAGVFR